MPRKMTRDLKLIEVYEHRLSINTNFSSRAGYARRINITVDAELCGQGPSAASTPTTCRCTHARNVVKRFLSFENSPMRRATSEIALEIIGSIHRRVSLKGFKFSQHHASMPWQLYQPDARIYGRREADDLESGTKVSQPFSIWLMNR